MRLRTLIIIGAVISIIAGYVFGKTVNADAPNPGSSSDPVVSKSYVDKAMEERMVDLEKQVAELSVQSQALQTMINELQDKLNKSGGKTTPTTPNKPTTPSNGESSGTNQPSSDEVIGKSAYVKSTNNYVNLRSSPSTDSNTIKQVQKDEAMKIFEVRNQWYHVELPDKTVGWVAGWVVDVK